MKGKVEMGERTRNEREGEEIMGRRRLKKCEKGEIGLDEIEGLKGFFCLAFIESKAS